MDKETVVIDIGARYGLHPSWSKLINSNFRFILFEPDSKESSRLIKKYNKKKSITVENLALGDEINNNKNLFLTEHSALSSIFFKKKNNPLLKKKSSKKIIKKIPKKKTALNKYCAKKKIIPHFLKLDSEGTELIILKNSDQILSKILGIRSEVSFDKIFKNNDEGDFCDLHKYLIENDFVLLNLDYEGKGFYYNKFISQDQKYGILQTTDAVWIKDPSKVNKYYKDSFSIMRISVFCFLNNAPDLAIFFLKTTSKKHNFFRKYKSTNIYNFLLKELARHLYSIRWSPGQNYIDHNKLFNKVFNLKLPKNNEKYDSLFYNP